MVPYGKRKEMQAPWITKTSLTNLFPHLTLCHWECLFQGTHCENLESFGLLGWQNGQGRTKAEKSLNQPLLRAVYIYISCSEKLPSYHFYLIHWMFLLVRDLFGECNILFSIVQTGWGMLMKIDFLPLNKHGVYISLCKDGNVSGRNRRRKEKEILQHGLFLAVRLPLMGS